MFPLYSQLWSCLCLYPWELPLFWYYVLGDWRLLGCLPLRSFSRWSWSMPCPHWCLLVVWVKCRLYCEQQPWLYLIFELVGILLWWLFLSLKSCLLCYRFGRCCFGALVATVLNLFHDVFTSSSKSLCVSDWWLILDFVLVYYWIESSWSCSSFLRFLYILNGFPLSCWGQRCPGFSVYVGILVMHLRVRSCILYYRCDWLVGCLWCFCFLSVVVGVWSPLVVLCFCRFWIFSGGFQVSAA